MQILSNKDLPYSDKPYSVLKPGQESLKRDYYKDVTTEQPNG